MTTLIPNLASVLVLAQAEGGLDPVTIGLIALAVVVLIILVFAVVRSLSKPEKPEITERRPPTEEGKVPTKDVLEERMEVEEPVEITDDMSLAEIKRIKAARVKGKGKRRETAAEATERAKREREEAERKAKEAAEKAEAEEAEEAPEEPVEQEEPVKEPVEEEKPAEEEKPVEEEEPAEEEPVEEEPAEEEPTEQEEPEVVEGPDVSEGTEVAEGPEVGEGADVTEGAEVTEAPESERKVKRKLPRPLPKPKKRPKPEPEVREEPEAPEEEPEPVADEEPEPAVEEKPAPEPEASEPKTLAQGLEKTRSGFIDRLSNLFSSEKLDEDIVDDVEEILFTADIGPHVAQEILMAVEEGLSGEEKRDPGRIWGFIRDYCAKLLKAHEEPLDLDSAKPYVMLVVGVNGAGKTTTIGKMASKYRDQGKSVLLVAGDTFRAGAVDQLAIWAERTDMPIHQGEQDADPSAVMYAGIERGIEEDVDVIICDTSGRLQTNVNLMDELAKMARVSGKALDGAPHETMLVLDANTGQNAIIQAKKFNEAVEISGIALTKLDGTARGGVILGICDELEAPVRYIGIGESVEDLREFDADEFVEALFM
ncbi:signal recognition particle-docking protein FtsY [Persicimonas caeni]|nr:signal recognition particle-docking protein FtsY [Persicimonas caeni]